LFEFDASKLLSPHVSTSGLMILIDAKPFPFLAKK